MRVAAHDRHVVLQCERPDPEVVVRHFSARRVERAASSHAASFSTCPTGSVAMAFSISASVLMRRKVASRRLDSSATKAGSSGERARSERWRWHPAIANFFHGCLALERSRAGETFCKSVAAECRDQRSERARSPDSPLVPNLQLRVGGRGAKPRLPVFHPWTKQSFADIGMTGRELGHEGTKLRSIRRFTRLPVPRADAHRGCCQRKAPYADLGDDPSNPRSSSLVSCNRETHLGCPATNRRPASK